jgi:hypothetical protein
MNDADRFGFKLLLGAALVVGLVPTLVGSAQACGEESVEEVGVVTIQAASPKTPTVGRPYTFTVFVKNNSHQQDYDEDDDLNTEYQLGVSVVSPPRPL